MALSLEHAFTLRIDVAPPIDVGPTPAGHRRVIPIIGGSFEGPALKGEVLPGGADWNLVRPDGAMHAWARYTIRTEDGALISVINEGLGSFGAPTDGGAGGQGAPNPGWYCPTRPQFEVGEGGPAWMNTTMFVGELPPPTRPDQVTVVVYKVVVT